MNYDWASFTKRIPIRAGISSVYKMWATSKGMEQWFLRLCVYTGLNNEPILKNTPVQQGNRYTWYWHGWDDATKETGTILETNGYDRLVFTFGPDDALKMKCIVQMITEENVTVCILHQENIPVDETGKSNYHLGCNTGWTFYLTNLKSILEGGIDLRNKDSKLKNVINS
jgi:uncharacterized protein YndB with AHSA1/START domain